MKRQTNSLISGLVAIMLLNSPFGKCQTTDYTDSIPKDLSQFIRAVKEPAEFKVIPDFVQQKSPMYITKQQANEDVEMIQYLFDNAYSGRYYWEKNGFDFEAYYKKLNDFVDTSTDTIDVRRLENFIYDGLSYINDGHTVIEGFSFHQLKKVIKPYYAELVIEKQGKKYIVIESEQSDIKVGTEFIYSEELLFRTLAATNKSQFLIGKLSDVNIDILNVKFDDGIRSLKLHPSKLSNIETDRWNNIVEIDTINNIPLVSCSFFIPYVSSSDYSWSAEKAKKLDEFTEYGKNLKDKPIFILNLIGNWGGDGNYPNRFIENFNGVSQQEVYSLVLHSPAVNQCYWPGKNSWLPWSPTDMKALNDDNYPLDSVSDAKREKIRKIRIEKQTVISNPTKYWEIKMKPEKKFGNYKGKAIFLVNNETGSAANDAIATSKSIPNSVIIGENTASSYTIGNMKWYQLKNSLIVFWLPGNLGVHPDNKMEKGFFPDYWLDSNKPADEVINWISNPYNYQFRYKNK